MGQPKTYGTSPRDARRHVLVTVTPESRTTHRLLFDFWFSWYHNRRRLVGRTATSSFRSPSPQTRAVFFPRPSPSHTPQPAAYGQPATLPRLLGSPGAMWKPLERLFS